jgi:ubiquinone/menaquinone biosynthesis C-methylase UbiE
VASEFVDWLAVPPAARWLDLGCGTGALAETILHLANPAQVDGIDPSEGYLALAREQVHDPRVQFNVGDARRLPVESATYDAVVSALVLNFIPDLPTGMAEMARAVRPGGTVAGYVWDYAGKMDWTPFLGGQFPAPDYAMSLNDAARGALRERIRAQLPIAADGSIPLIARAWAVRGTR